MTPPPSLLVSPHVCLHKERPPAISPREVLVTAIGDVAECDRFDVHYYWQTMSLCCCAHVRVYVRS